MTVQLICFFKADNRIQRSDFASSYFFQTMPITFDGDQFTSLKVYFGIYEVIQIIVKAQIFCFSLNQDFCILPYLINKMIRDPIDIKNSNIWEKSKANRSQSSLNSPNDVVIILGEKRSGKSSFVKILKSDFDLQTKPTYLIDYNCIKKNRQNTIESIQISSPELLQALEYYINENNCHNVTLVTCVDLTKGNNLVERINSLLQKTRTICKQIVQKNKFSQIKAYNQNRGRCFAFIQKNEDVELIKRMPFRSMIVGCKYDLFQKMNVEHKKWISRTLRYIAHVNQSSFLCCSTKNMQIGAEIRNIFNNELSMARNSKLTNQKEYNKPFFILSGQDKISQMSLPAFNNSGAFNQLKILQQQISSIFPDTKPVKTQANKAKFRFIGLDTLINRNKKQIQKSIQQIVRKGQDPLKSTFMRTDNISGKFPDNSADTRDFSKKTIKKQAKKQQNKQQKQSKRPKKEEQNYLDQQDEAAEEEYL